MTSIVLNNLPCNVRPINGIDGPKYAGLEPSVNLKLVCFQPPNRVCTCRYSLVNATSNESMKKFVRDVPPISSRPASPNGTTLVYPLPDRGSRLHGRSPVLSVAQEKILTPANFVYPLFIHEGKHDIATGSMPGCYRLGWRHGLIEEVSRARDVGVNRILLLPTISDDLKSSTCREARNWSGLVPRAIMLLKEEYPDLAYGDVSLYHYSSDGYDGIVGEDGVILNDETLHQLCKQAVAQALAGADVIKTGHQMDGCVRAIRDALDDEGFEHVSIMAYAAKYFSSFYLPFQKAFSSFKLNYDNRTYQRYPLNFEEALVDALTDDALGADFLLVEPGLPYMDIIRLLRDNSPVPIAAYQASGEYAMIKAGAAMKMYDEESVMMESLMCLRGAGADIIVTYFALQPARCLCGEKR